MHDGFVDIIFNFHFVNEFWVLVTPLSLMAIDIITGTVNAFAKKQFRSKRMRMGLSKKTGEIAILVLGELFSFSLGLPHYIMSCVSFYIIMMEFMSIMENIDNMCVPLPKFIGEVINNKDETISEEQYLDMANKLKKAMDLIDELESKNKGGLK